MSPDRRFLFRLALASGYWVCNPDAMMAAMPWRIYQEWLRFYEAEPFGETPLRLGYAAAMLGNLLGKPKHGLGWKMGQFMPYGAPVSQGQPVGRRKAGKTDKEQADHVLSMAMMGGWTVIDKRNKEAG